MCTVDAPRGADGQPLLPGDIWLGLHPAAQAVIVALVQRIVALEGQVRDLQARLGQNSSNSSRPPSSDLPGTPRKRPPPAGPSGRRAGGQPGHTGHFRALVPPERVDTVVDHWPGCCVGCTTPLVAQGEDEDYVAHQVTELPPVRASPQWGYPW